MKGVNIMKEQKNVPLMQRFLDAGYNKAEMYHHESDLYVFVTPVTTKVIDEWSKENGYDKNWHCPIFTDQVTGRQMYDCAFQYYQNN